MPRPEPSDRTAVITVRVSPEFQELVTQVARRVHGKTVADFLRHTLEDAVWRDRIKLVPDTSEKKIPKSRKKVVD